MQRPLHNARLVNLFPNIYVRTVVVLSYTLMAKSLAVKQLLIKDELRAVMPIVQMTGMLGPSHLDETMQVTWLLARV